MICDWDVSYTRCESSKDVAFLESVSEDVKATAESMAVELLSNWTGNRFGVCPFVVRPYKDNDKCKYLPRGNDFFSGAVSRTLWTPTLIGGRWYNLHCDSCSSNPRDAREYNAVKLPRGLYEVTAVWVNGLKLTPGRDYLVSNNAVYPNGSTIFPEFQDTLADYTIQGEGTAPTFAIEFKLGRPVPQGGQVAAGVLAIELMRALCKDKNCALPQRIQTVTRQGVTVGFVDNFDDLKEGHTGIWLVDAWVASQREIRPPSGVFSPDGGSSRKGAYKF